MAGIDERIEESKNWFERFLEKVPGYRAIRRRSSAGRRTRLSGSTWPAGSIRA